MTILEVTMISVVVIVVVLVWAGAVINTEVLAIGVRADVVIGTLVDAEIIAVAVVVITSEFAVPGPYSADVLPDVLVDALVNTFTGPVMDIVSGIGVEVVSDIYGFTAAMTVLEVGVPAPSEAFSR